MKILIEANSVVPGHSGGIEYFLYALIKAWKSRYPEDDIYLHIPPGTQQEYIERIGKCNFLVDPFYRFVSSVIELTRLGRVITSRLRRLRFFSYCMSGMRKKWIRSIDKKVDVVIYPFQREMFVHNPRKVIFVMHDFRMFDMPGGDKFTIENQISAISKSAYIVSSWPFPFARLNEKFPDKTGRYYKIPFLYDPMDLQIDNNIAGDFLYYPAGMTAHKNHTNLIKSLYIYNNNKSGKRLKLICTGPEVKELKMQLSKLVDDLKMTDDVSFLGFVSREKVFNLYNTCYAVIAPTLYEAFSGPVMEAFRFEKPALCSNIPAHEYFLNEYGLTLGLFDPNKPENIAESIEQLSNNYEYHRQLSIKGKKRLSFITPEFTAQAYHELAAKIAEPIYTVY